MTELEAKIFNRCIVEDEPGGCWRFQGAKVPAGYGMTQWEGRMQSIHRIVYRETFGEIPKGYHVHHLCKTKDCCNPDHLVAVSKKEHREIEPSPSIRYNATHCIHGHEFTPENTYVKPNGFKACRSCCTLRARARNGVVNPYRKDI